MGLMHFGTMILMLKSLFNCKACSKLFGDERGIFAFYCFLLKQSILMRILLNMF